MSTHENEVYLHDKYEKFRASQSGFDRAVILHEMKHFGMDVEVETMIEDWWTERLAWLNDRGVNFKDIITDEDGLEYYMDIVDHGDQGDGYQVDNKKVEIPDWLNVDYWARHAYIPKKKQEEVEDMIVCDCNDPSCPKRGIEGEVGGHIEECSCGDCHRALGKISS